MLRPASCSSSGRIYPHSRKLKQELDPFSPPTMTGSQGKSGVHYHAYPATVELVHGTPNNMECVTGTVVACHKRDSPSIVGQTVQVAGRTLCCTGKVAVNGVSFVVVRATEALIQSTVSTAVSTAFVSTMVVGGNWAIKLLLKRAFS